MNSQKIMLIAIGLLLSLSNSLNAAPLGQNLIVNSNAEAGNCDSVGNKIESDIPTIPGWTTTGNFSVLCYGATGFTFVNMMGQTVQVSGLPDANSPGPDDRGNNLFYGGGDRSSSAASQLIDLSDLTSLIDAGRAGYNLQGWLGGYRSDADRASLIVNFLDIAGQSLAVASIIAPTASERNDTTGLFLRVNNGVLPWGTRQLEVTLDMNYVRGRVNDSYADNLFFAVTTVPEPRTPLVLLSLSFLAWVGIRVRRN